MFELLKMPNKLNNIIILLLSIFLINQFVKNPQIVSGKPTFTTNGFPSFDFLSRFGFRKRETNASGLQSSRQRDDFNVKPFSGIRVRNDSLRMIYYYDQTIAVAEIGPEKLLLNCELIEVIEPIAANETLHKLSREISRPLMITLDDMLMLMSQCEMLDEDPQINKVAQQSNQLMTEKNDVAMPPPSTLAVIESRFNFFGGGRSVFSGIAPGTKWCGSGDIAQHYHDLGSDVAVDKCCRTHDICPVKIPKYKQRYTLFNDSPFTRSLCQCDMMLYNCLKQSNSTSGNIFGNIFFNLVQTTCIDRKTDGKWIFRKNKSVF